MGAAWLGRGFRGRWAPAGPLVGLLAGRALAWLLHGGHVVGGHAVGGHVGPPLLAAAAGLLAFRAWRRDPARIPAHLRRVGVVLIGVQALALAGVQLVHPNVLAHLLLLCLPGFLALAPRYGRGHLAPTALMVLVIGSTTCKGAGAAAVLALLVHVGRGWWALAAAPAVACGLYVFRPYDVIGRRLELWGAALDVWRRSPLVGAGPGAAIADWTPHGIHGHNLLLTTLAWSGVAGALLLGWGIWAALREYGRGRPAHTWALAGLAGATLHYCVDDLSSSTVALVLLAGLLAAQQKAPAG